MESRSRQTHLFVSFDKITSLTDKSNCTGAASFDFSKAFDLVPCDILIEKCDYLESAEHAIDGLKTGSLTDFEM